LPISRRLAELLRGSLSVKSEPGHGSTFRLSLPATAERTATTRLADQDMTPRPTDDRTARGQDGDDNEGAEEPQAAGRMAS
jgi:hypothetical protein